TFSVSANPDPGSRTGTITIADQVFTVTQKGTSSFFFISSITPASGPVAGGTAVSIIGGGFQSGATVTLGGVPATVNSVTSSQIAGITGNASVSGTVDVVVTNPDGGVAVLENGFTYVAGPVSQEANLFVPIVLSAAGMNKSYFTSELTLSNRGSQNAMLDFEYTAAFGGGSGQGTDSLPAGQQKVIPDAIAYLKSIGVPIPDAGSRGGTLLVKVSGIASSQDAAVTVRTTTVVPEGRAGLAYAGIPRELALAGPSYLCGLRQSQTDRSNVAVQHAGSTSDGNITLRLTVFSGEGNDPSPHVLPDQVLSPGGFTQISGILASNGLSLSNGYVRVERISGTAPYYAYGVINDQVNSDGSFVPPLLEGSLAGKTRLTLPVVVEANAFTTELVVTNWTSSRKRLNCRYVAEAIQAANGTASFTIDTDPSQQLIWPNLVEKLRDAQVGGVG
ncbi:MAG TPA: IPT/TIG domain-containing protein, partial [Candidatus Acidoferrum sp.]|nr:IPT/TIG domain-containing protein [Candidatus Acidoferrum sp.]